MTAPDSALGNLWTPDARRNFGGCGKSWSVICSGPKGIAMSESQRRQYVVATVSLTQVVCEYIPPYPDDTGRRFLCPFHNDRVGTFELDLDGRRFRCRECGVEGDVVDFVRMFEGIDVSGALDLLENWPHG